MTVIASAHWSFCLGSLSPEIEKDWKFQGDLIEPLWKIQHSIAISVPRAGENKIKKRTVIVRGIFCAVIGGSFVVPLYKGVFHVSSKNLYINVKDLQTMVMVWKYLWNCIILIQIYSHLPIFQVKVHSRVHFKVQFYCNSKCKCSCKCNAKSISKMQWTVKLQVHFKMQLKAQLKVQLEMQF